MESGVFHSKRVEQAFLFLTGWREYEGEWPWLSKTAIFVVMVCDCKFATCPTALTLSASCG